MGTAPIHSHDACQTSLLGSKQPNYFEGREKKLQLCFSPINPINDSPTGQHMPQLETMRSLSCDDIKLFLDAAGCKILSSVSNATTDAYLLSESSLFISDFCLTLKTCGTTPLLHALPIIKRLALDRLSLALVSVQFSRVAYCFPYDQSFPHNCFEDEVSFLDIELDIKGRHFETQQLACSYWYFYVAKLEHHENKKCCSLDHHYHHELSIQDGSVSKEDKNVTLEVFMFGLDPSVMNQFMFHDLPHLVGTDSITNGVTFTTGIYNLLGATDAIDAYNFEPCGYSLNSLALNSFCSIHISPEPEVSYVSFETKTTSALFPGILSNVVKLFKPSQFSVSLVGYGVNSSQEGLPSVNSWTPVSETHNVNFSQSAKPSYFYSGSRTNVFAEVSSYSRRDCVPTHVMNRLFCENVNVSHVEKLLECEALKKKDVCAKMPSFFNAFLFPGLCNTSSDRSKRIIVLSRVLSKYTEMKAAIGTKNIRLRYSVSCNWDKAILMLLNKLDIEFEIMNEFQLEILKGLNVKRERIVLVSPVSSPAITALYESVGKVAVFGTNPCHTESKALTSLNMDVEVRINSSSIDHINRMLSKVFKCYDNVTSVALEVGTGTENVSQKKIQLCLQEVEHFLSTLPTSRRKSIDIHVGELRNRNTSHFGDGTADMKIIAKKIMSLAFGYGYLGVDISRFLVRNSTFLVSRIIGRRCRQPKCSVGEEDVENTIYNYYLNDGIYGSFFEIGLVSNKTEGIEDVIPQVIPFMIRRNSNGCVWLLQDDCIASSEAEDWRMSVLFGPTCDAFDKIWTGKLPVLDVDDTIIFSNMGTYSSRFTRFNGFGRDSDVRYIL